MIPQELIQKKRDNISLSSDEINSFFIGYLDQKVTDYQMSAMLMAIFFRGMSPVETATLTKVARDSGLKFNWNSNGNVIDKHSTGGIGDKTSIILLPLCLLEGLQIPMMAGRGLGHTGGTLDKLESIPGMKVFCSPDEVKKQIADVKGIFMGQTKDVAALDRQLYSLRDVTATVESIPLIVASILSKKLSEGLDGLVMDVKYGSGAFMQDPKDAEALAQALIDVGRECNLKVKAFLTDMNSPLGSYAGNALEIYECVEILKGEGPEDTKELSLELAKQMVLLARPDENPDSVMKRLKDHLSSGRAYEKFQEIIAYQGGDISFLENKDNFFQAKIKHPVIIENRDSYIASIDTKAIGMAIIHLGGGRKKVSDNVDPFVGISGLHRVGTEIPKKEPIAWIHANDQKQLQEAESIVKNAYQFSSEQKTQPLIGKTLG